MATNDPHLKHIMELSQNRADTPEEMAEVRPLENYEVILSHPNFTYENLETLGIDHTQPLRPTDFVRLSILSLGNISTATQYPWLNFPYILRTNEFYANAFDLSIFYFFYRDKYPERNGIPTQDEIEVIIGSHETLIKPMAQGFIASEQDGDGLFCSTLDELINILLSGDRLEDIWEDVIKDYQKLSKINYDNFEIVWWTDLTDNMTLFDYIAAQRITRQRGDKGCNSSNNGSVITPSYSPYQMAAQTLSKEAFEKLYKQNEEQFKLENQAGKLLEIALNAPGLLINKVNILCFLIDQNPEQLLKTSGNKSSFAIQCLRYFFNNSSSEVLELTLEPIIAILRKSLDSSPDLKSEMDTYQNNIKNLQSAIEYLYKSCNDQENELKHYHDTYEQLSNKVLLLENKLLKLQDQLDDQLKKGKEERAPRYLSKPQLQLPLSISMQVDSAKFSETNEITKWQAEFLAAVKKNKFKSLLELLKKNPGILKCMENNESLNDKMRELIRSQIAINPFEILALDKNSSSIIDYVNNTSMDAKRITRLILSWLGRLFEHSATCHISFRELKLLVKIQFEKVSELNSVRKNCVGILQEMISLKNHIKYFEIRINELQNQILQVEAELMRIGKIGNNHNTCIKNNATKKPVKGTKRPLSPLTFQPINDSLELSPVLLKSARLDGMSDVKSKKR